MSSWVRRCAAPIALAGAVCLDLAARGAPARVAAAIAAFQGDAIVSLAGPAAGALVAAALLLALSPAGRSRR